MELSSVLNPEIYTKWFVAALSVKYAPVVPLVQKHLSQHGRMKFVRGIYKSLSQYDSKIAVDTFLANQSLYYGITYTLTKADLKIWLSDWYSPNIISIHMQHYCLSLFYIKLNVVILSISFLFFLKIVIPKKKKKFFNKFFYFNLYI